MTARITPPPAALYFSRHLSKAAFARLFSVTFLLLLLSMMSALAQSDTGYDANGNPWTVTDQNRQPMTSIYDGIVALTCNPGGGGTDTHPSDFGYYNYDADLFCPYFEPDYFSASSTLESFLGVGNAWALNEIDNSEYYYNGSVYESVFSQHIQILSTDKSA